MTTPRKKNSFEFFPSVLFCWKLNSLRQNERLEKISNLLRNYMRNFPLTRLSRSLSIFPWLAPFTSSPTLHFTCLRRLPSYSHAREFHDVMITFSSLSSTPCDAAREHMREGWKLNTCADGAFRSHLLSRAFLLSLLSQIIVISSYRIKSLEMWMRMLLLFFVIIYNKI